MTDQAKPERLAFASPSAAAICAAITAAFGLVYIGVVVFVLIVTGAVPWL